MSTGSERERGSGGGIMSTKSLTLPERGRVLSSGTLRYPHEWRTSSLNSTSRGHSAIAKLREGDSDRPSVHAVNSVMTAAMSVARLLCTSVLLGEREAREQRRVVHTVVTRALVDHAQTKQTAPPPAERVASRAPGRGDRKDIAPRDGVRGLVAGDRRAAITALELHEGSVLEPQRDDGVALGAATQLG